MADEHKSNLSEVEMGCQPAVLVHNILRQEEQLVSAASLKHRVSVAKDGSASRTSRSRLDLKGDEPFLGIGQDGEIRVGILPKM